MKTEKQEAKSLRNNKIKHNTSDKKDMIAQRKSCSANGVGLSHYILVEREVK